MLEIIFSSKDRRRTDRAEIKQLYKKYADDTARIVRKRAQDQCLSERDRRHWARLYRTMIFSGIIRS